jgi:hypothetical protein
MQHDGRQNRSDANRHAHDGGQTAYAKALKETSALLGNIECLTLCRHAVTAPLNLSGRAFDSKNR